MPIAKLLAAVAVALFSAHAAAQYPDKPIRIVVPFASAGVADLLARVVAQKITEQTGKVVVVENKTGAGGRIGYEAGAKSAPDGYTFVATDVTYTMMPALYPSLPWNHADLVPVALLAQMPFVVVVGGKAKMDALPQLVANARTNPKKLNYGSAGVGSVNHVVTELFTRTAGVEMTHVPYRGMGEAMTGLLGGTVDVLVTAMPTAMSQIKGGAIVPLGVTSSQRSSALGSIPTTTEGGVAFVASNWIGLTAPRGTPQEAIDWMQKSVAAAVAAPDVRERFLAQGAEPSGVGVDVFGKLMQGETTRWGDVIRSAKIAAE